MRLLICGDVVGKAGRDSVLTHIPRLRQELKLDFIVVNGDNAAHGFGINRKICDEFIAAGVDVITAGDHVWDQQETKSFIGQYPALLRPHNFPSHTPGTGVRVYESFKGEKVLVMHLQAQVFMKYQLDNPFECAKQELAKHQLRGTVDAIIVDFHGEASSEKMAMGHFLDGKVSVVVGTHTHVPTADTMILPGGTAYQTDLGMCGDFNSVIGFDKRVPLAGFTDKMKTEKFEVATGEATLCGIYVETDPKTGLAKKVSPVRVGGRLQQIVPSI